MDALGREHVRAHGIDQWHQHRRRGADPIGKRREVELDPIVGLGPAYLHHSRNVLGFAYRHRNAEWQCCNQKHGVWPAVG